MSCFETRASAAARRWTARVWVPGAASSVAVAVKGAPSGTEAERAANGFVTASVSFSRAEWRAESALSKSLSTPFRISRSALSAFSWSWGCRSMESMLWTSCSYGSFAL